MLWILTALALPAAASPPVTRDIVIEGHRLVCMGECISLCAATEGGLMYDPIEGLPFSWGRRRTVRVAVTPVENPPADASSVVFSLIEVLSDEPVTPGTSFEWSADFRLSHMGYTSPIDLATRTLSAGRAFTCAEAECQVLASAIAAGQRAAIRFEFADPIRGPLHLTAVRVQAQ